MRRSIAALATLVTLTAFSAPAGAAPLERLPGIDVSRFQERIAWQLVGQTEVRFAYVQASRGSGADCAVVPERCGADFYYERNTRRARAVGVRVGAYHRAFVGGVGRGGVRADAIAEARVFIGEVGALAPGDLRPALDLESPFGELRPAQVRHWIATWLERVERKLGAKPLIYTNASSWSATGDTTRFAARGHPLWVANFDVPRPQVPAANWNGASWSIWQHSSTGSVPGIEGNVDLNLLRGGLEALSVGRR